MILLVRLVLRLLVDVVRFTSLLVCALGQAFRIRRNIAPC